MSIPILIDRLKARVPALGNRVAGARTLAPLLEGNEVPHETPCAFVLPLGLDADKADLQVGLHRQMLRVQYGVLLVITFAGDAIGDDSMAEIDVLARAIRESLSGFQPAGDDTLTLIRERLVNFNAGTVFYQLDFALYEQMRIVVT